LRTGLRGACGAAREPAAGGRLAGSLALTRLKLSERGARLGEKGDLVAARPGQNRPGRDVGGTDLATRGPAAATEAQRCLRLHFHERVGREGYGGRGAMTGKRGRRRYLRARVRIFPGRGQGGGSCAHNHMFR
jgi:hypothetical protein